MAYCPPMTMDSLREYVTAPSAAQKQSASTVVLFITHSNLTARFPEMRLDLCMTIADMKDKLYARTGTSASHMKLIMKDARGNTVAELANEQAMLFAYHPQNGYIVHIQDTDPNSNSRGGWLENTSLVKKYELSDEAYNKRPGNFKVPVTRHNLLGTSKGRTKTHDVAIKNFLVDGSLQLDTFRTFKMNKAKENINVDDAEDFQKDAADQIKVEDRCEVHPGGRRGTVKFIGQAESLPPGYWIGVEFDEPVGRNDGSAKGVRYFTCKFNYGEIVRPSKVTIGDFAPLEDDLDFTDEEL